MPTNIASYINSNLDQLGTNAALYSTDFVGASRMLEDAGFSPFTKASPLDSTLSQIFNRFVQKTGLDSNSNDLKDQFLQKNPTTRQALGLYNSLENTFGSKSSGQQAAIVDFLNTKFDEFVTGKDSDSDNLLAQEESGLDDTLFNEVDSDQDYQLSADELKNNFYNNFSELNNVLNYFQGNRGVLIDVLA
jgi:hypothetical protein